MRSFIFVSIEGNTFQPLSNEIEPDIENCQVMGFSHGYDPSHAFRALVSEHPFLLDTTFNELIAYELCGAPDEHHHVSLDSLRTNGRGHHAHH